MELYVARQPVFDENRAIIGYELLHRDSIKQKEYSNKDGEYASSRVITSAFLTMGLDSLTDSKLAFINFTADLLMSGVASLLPKEQLVVEILESVAPTREIVKACRELKAQGYMLALDDYVLDPVFAPLAMMADFIKVDFRQLAATGQYNAVSLNQGHGVRFVAEKVETEEEFLRAADLGYTLFQGYFFAKPVVLSANALPAGKLGYIRLMQAVNNPNPDFSKIVAAIESDVTLSLETIKLSNSAYYGRRLKISSIRQAVVALGIEGVRKWIYLSSLRRLNTGKPDILVSTSVIRSKFMQLISEATGQRLKGPEYSMLGLFSLLDAITDCPFEALFAMLNIAEEVQEALLCSDCSTKIGYAYRTLLAYERAEWESAIDLADMLGLTLDNVAGAYMASIKWYSNFMRTHEG
jgi:c-di-GMP-related signal transduction protein